MMDTDPATPRLIPGSEVVGRGVTIIPNTPYSLKRSLVKAENCREYVSQETKQKYLVPDAFDLEDSPPMPVKKALNQVVIEESFERFETHFALDAKVAASNAVFSVDANLGQSNQIRSEDDVYYALRSSFIPFWSVYLPDPPELPEAVWKDLPKEFNFIHRQIYQDFFEKYGTHYVQRAWVGGQAKLVLTVLKSSDFSKKDIQAGISGNIAAIGNAKHNESTKENKERLQKNSTCTVWGKGGHEDILASLSKLDETEYNAWLKTVRDNPVTIEIEVKGIWTLIKDEKIRDALMRAYEMETSAPYVTSGFILTEPDPDDSDNNVRSTAYIIQQDHYIAYDFKNATTQKPRRVNERWPALKDKSMTFGWVDASFQLGDSLYMFSRNRYTALTIDGKPDPTNPTRHGVIEEDWRGLPFRRIDAAFSSDLNYVYFFSGDMYVRYNIIEDSVDEGYPQPISKRWVGVTFERIDAVIYRPDTNKVYFFRGNQHIRYDMSLYRADAGYPKTIVSTYVQDWRL